MYFYTVSDKDRALYRGFTWKQKAAIFTSNAILNEGFNKGLDIQVVVVGAFTRFRRELKTWNVNANVS